MSAEAEKAAEEAAERFDKWYLAQNDEHISKYEFEEGFKIGASWQREHGKCEKCKYYASSFSIAGDMTVTRCDHPKIWSKDFYPDKDFGCCLWEGKE